MALGGSEEQEMEHFPTVRDTWAGAIEFLLSSRRLRSRGCSFDEPDRRAIYEGAVLRQPKDVGFSSEPGTLDQSQASAEADEEDGDSGHLSWTQYEPTPDRTCDLPLSSEGFFDQTPQSGLECRYHLHPVDARLWIPGGDFGLV